MVRGGQGPVWGGGGGAGVKVGGAIDVVAAAWGNVEGRCMVVIGGETGAVEKCGEMD